MGYRKSLEAAGAEVSAFEEFGSYQGDWWAKVTFNGVTGFVTGCYGSCSGCDAFEAEFGWGNDETPEKLAAFGKEYLDDILTYEQALAKASEYAEWDMDAKEVVDFLRKHDPANPVTEI